MNNLLKRVDDEIASSRNFNPVVTVGMLAIREMVAEAQENDSVDNNNTTVVWDIIEEIQKAMKVNPLFTSPHHGYAVILEELDELWDEVKKRKPDAKNMRAEAVQVAAMSMKFIMSIENDWKSVPQAEWSEEKIRQNEAKCLQCKYTILTDEQLAEMKEDPCNTCHDLSNWK